MISTFVYSWEGLSRLRRIDYGNEMTFNCYAFNPATQSPIAFACDDFLLSVAVGGIGLLGQALFSSFLSIG